MNFKKILAFTTSIILCNIGLVNIPDTNTGLNSISVNADTSESCGEYCKYSFDSATGTLTISGSGDMTNYIYDSDVPWHDNIGDIKSVIIEDGVTSIGNYAFTNGTSIESVSLPNTLLSINRNAFWNCNTLTTIDIPNSVKTISSDAFMYCDNLENISVSDSNLNYTSVDGVLFNKDMSQLVAYPNGNKRTEYTIPTEVTSIGNNAFYMSNYLKEVTIPSTVVSIGAYAFYSNSHLETVNFKSIDELTIDKYAFVGTPYYSHSKTTDGFYITDEGILLGVENNDDAQLSIPDSVKYIVPRAFNSYCKAESIVLNSSCRISNSAFCNCKNLESVIVNGNCTTEYQPFMLCDKLHTFNVKGNLNCSGSLTDSDTLTDVTYDRISLNYDDISVEENTLRATKKSFSLEESMEYSTYGNITSYYTFGAVDLLQEVSDLDGNIYALYGYKDTVNMVSYDGNITKFEKDGYTFGSATIGDDNCLYIMWGKSISDDIISESLNEENVVIDKYSLDGTLIKSLGLPVQTTEAQFPFDAGNSNIAYSNGYIGLIFDTEWLKTSDGYHHQGSDFVLIDAKDLEFLSIDTLSMSHSFGVSMMPTSYGFDVIQLSDDGPRGINLMRYYPEVESIWSEPTNDTTTLYHCSGKYGSNENQLDGNTTYTYMGGFAKSNSTYAMVGKSERVYTSDIFYSSSLRTKNFDVFVKIADNTLYSSASSDCAGVNRIDEATGKVADTNIIWLTQCDETKKAGNVKVVTLSSGAYCIMWENFINDKFDSIKYVIIDECGNIIRNESTITNARLSNTSIQPIVQGDTIYWAVADKSTNNIDFYSVNLNDSSAISNLGDLNDDDEINYLDLLLLKKYILNIDTTSNLYNADVNQDGSINILDVIELKNIILSNAPEPDIKTVLTGSCGENATFTLTDDNTLTISGTGTMFDYNFIYGDEVLPWNEYLNSIKKIVVTEGITSIGRECFARCPYLKEVYLPDSLENIGMWAFYGDSYIDEINIPSKVDTIDYGAFEKCTYLNRINVSEENSNFSDINGVLFNYDKSTILKYPEGLIDTTYEVPNSVVNIGTEAFIYCNYLKKVILNYNAKDIGTAAFYGCENLKSVTMPQTIEHISSDAFTDCKSLDYIFFQYTKEKWDSIKIDTPNDVLLNTTIRFSMEGDPENTAGILYDEDGNIIGYM